MTKAEAQKLEKRCDKIMSGYLGEECTVCMALSGKLKIIFTNDESFVTLNNARNEADYINYTGFYSDLSEKISKVIECVSDNYDIFEYLIWSYENRTELED